MTQMVLAAMSRSSCHENSTSSRRRPVRLCVTLPTGVVQTSPSPDSLPLTAAADNRCDDGVRLVVVDDEDEQRLRQEARLEHAAAVLVRDAALAPVADRLDHRHADVARLLLDRVDHRLDPLADHDRLDLRHARPPPIAFENTTSRQTRPARRSARARRRAEPHPRCRRRLASFSGKIQVWIVQIPAASRPRDTSSSSAGRRRGPAPRGDVDAVLRDAAVAAPTRPARARPSRRPRSSSSATTPELRSAPRPTPPTTAPISKVATPVAIPSP